MSSLFICCHCVMGCRQYSLLWQEMDVRNALAPWKALTSSEAARGTWQSSWLVVVPRHECTAPADQKVKIRAFVRLQDVIRV